jgi:hypothetical protein
MTRRDALRIGLALPGMAALPALAGSSKTFWNDKPPSDWTKSEIEDLLNRSPWAKEVNVADNGPGIDFSNLNRGNGGNGGGSQGMGGGPPGLPSGPPMGKPFARKASVGHFTATVRWDSASPVREAMHVKPSKNSELYYIIAVAGDLPDVGRVAGAEDATMDERRLESLRVYTKLERKGTPISLSHVTATPSGYPGAGGTLFYFERADVSEEKQLAFVTRVGTYEVRARFNLKEMLYHGKLDL